MGRKVLVTGGAGFIGSHVSEELLRRGHEVAVLDNLSGGSASQVPAAAGFYELDITESVDKAFEDFRPHDVIHLAAQVSVAVSMQDPEMDARINVLGSLNVIRAAERHGAIRFAHSDMSGISLFEEAQYHGVRAAEEVMRELGHAHPSSL